MWFTDLNGFNPSTDPLNDVCSECVCLLATMPYDLCLDEKMRLPGNNRQEDI